MPTLTDPAVIKELLQRHGFSFPVPSARISSSTPAFAPAWRNWAAPPPG